MNKAVIQRSPLVLQKLDVKFQGIDPPGRQGRRTWAIRTPLGIGLAALAALFGLLFLWGTTLEISGAVIANGQVEVSSSLTAVQHPVGGVVAEVLAKNGDKVRRGDIVLRLDDTQLRSDLAAVEGELFEILGNEARLMVELDDQKTLSPGPHLARGGGRQSPAKGVAGTPATPVGRALPVAGYSSEAA